MTWLSGTIRMVRNITIALAGVIVLAVLVMVVVVRVAFTTEGEPMEAIQKIVVSKDGTHIAYEQIGQGPVVLLISAALADRSGNRRLANKLAEQFTVINYDRRGRGESGDTPPYATQRELEDIAALIDANGGSVYLFGSSSGAVLALDAAVLLGPKVRKLYMYEPPFIVDSSRPPMEEALSSEIGQQVANGDRGEAVRLFFTKAMGMPSVAVTMMRFLMPGWSKMSGMAHTIPYDLAIVSGTQTGKDLPVSRWRSASLPIRVVVGSKSEPFFHNGARSLAEMLPSAQYESLPGLNHGALLLAPGALARDIQTFLLQTNHVR